MSPPNETGMGGSLVPYLSRMAHFSSPFITIFVLIHLSAPVVANMGGSSLASQTMLLGREYYQTSFGEKYLVLAPIVVHTFSATVKRVLKPPRRVTSLLTVTGYAAMVVFLPIHFMVHRVLPTDPSPTILELGPSELDYEFVKFGLHTWPWRSAILYGGLVLCVSLHMVDGMAILWNTYLSPAWGRVKESSRTLRQGGVLAGIVGPVLVGLGTMASEPSVAFASMARRYESVFLSSWVYGL